MKKLILVITFLLFSSTAQATLINNLDGTITQIKNDSSMLMWEQNAKVFFGDWAGANTWIAGMNISNYLGYNDWRLAETLPSNGSTYDNTWAADGSTDTGYNIGINSELSNLYYEGLGNLGYYDTSGSSPQPGWGLSNIGPFNIASYTYWSGTEYAPNSAWGFDFGDGQQYVDNKVDHNYAWAVRDVAPVPEPATMTLLGIGLFGVAVVKIRKRTKRPPIPP